MTTGELCGDPRIRCWPVGEPKAVVHVVHGIVEHAGRYEWFARQLNASQIAVYAHDHRGHGNNPDPSLGLGHFGDPDGWRLLIQDTWLISKAVMLEHSGVPCVLFAHSMGSFIAQDLIAEHGSEYAGVILAGSCGAPDFAENSVRGLTWIRAQLNPRSRAKYIQDLIFGTYNRQFRPNRTRSDWLSRDCLKVDEYEADRLCQFVVTHRSWLDFLDGKRDLTSRTHLRKIPKTLPIHIISGACDPVGRNGEGVQSLIDAYRAEALAVTSKIYPGARHELVNEENRLEIVRDVVAWIASTPRHGMITTTAASK